MCCNGHSHALLDPLITGILVVGSPRPYKRRAKSDILTTTRTGVKPNRGIAMLLTQGDIVMRILSKRDLKEMVLYSPQHVARLEKAGQFPKRIQLGPNRVGWLESEVQDWIAERMELRGDQTSS